MRRQDRELGDRDSWEAWALCSQQEEAWEGTPTPRSLLPLYFCPFPLSLPREKSL